MDIISSFKNRNIDDWADLANLWIKIGLPLFGVGIISAIIGVIGDISVLRLGSLGGSFCFGGLVILSAGLCSLGMMAYLRALGGEYASTGGNLKQIKTAPVPQLAAANVEKEAINSFGFEDEEEEESAESMTNDDIGKPDEEVSSLLNELFGDNKDDSDNSFPFLEKKEEEKPVEETKDIDYDDLLSKVRPDTTYLNRQMLFDTFHGFFPLCSKDFADIKEYDPGDEIYATMGAKINKALELLLPNKLPEVREVQIENIRETHFAYEVTFSRIKDKSLKLTALADEMLNHFKEKVNDEDISITIETIGDKNIAIITKGASSPVTVGDCFTKSDVAGYITDTKHKLPFISGITELGEVQMSDLKDYLTMCITGRPRSGKSWYVNSILTTLAAFNTPEDIQFIIVDPKKTALFKTFALLPHVAGLHDGTDILDVFRDIMESEAERRKKLLADARVDNIWEYMDSTGVKLPVIMIVIDEIVTIYSDLKEQNLHKEFQNYIKKILTQLPFIGIGLMMIPHRTTGILDPLTRMNVSYKSAVMATQDAIKEELGISGWNRPLTLPGDMAVTTASWKSPRYLKGTGLAVKDSETRKLIEEMAKAWYKIGVELPDMNSVGVGFNRDEAYVKEELRLTEKGNRIQYDTLNLDKD
jgi:hypothetical protein